MYWNNVAGRYANMKELTENEQFNKFLQMTSERPLVVAGDFNSPSHLDWVEETKSVAGKSSRMPVEFRQIHGGWVFDWPATKLLMDYANVTDSFRAIHPNVTQTPGMRTTYYLDFSFFQETRGPL